MKFPDYGGVKCEDGLPNHRDVCKACTCIMEYHPDSHSDKSKGYEDDKIAIYKHSQSWWYVDIGSARQRVFVACETNPEASQYNPGIWLDYVAALYDEATERKTELDRQRAIEAQQWHQHHFGKIDDSDIFGGEW